MDAPARKTWLKATASAFTFRLGKLIDVRDSALKAGAAGWGLIWTAADFLRGWVWTMQSARQQVMSMKTHFIDISPRSTP